MKLSRAVTGMDKSGSFRVYMAVSTSVVQEAYERHNTSPAATQLLGRALTGTGLMGLMLREPGYKITLQFKGDGPAQQILCTADSAGGVKGYIVNPALEMPVKDDGTADMGAALGDGILTCIRNTAGSKEPYVGKVKLTSGEIAEDIASYFYTSEQIRTLVSLGVKLDEDGGAAAAGGLIVQLLPDAEEGAIEALENWMPDMPSISELALKVSDGAEGKNVETVMQEYLERAFLGMPDDYSVSMLETPEFVWHCDCSEQRLDQVLISLGHEEIDKMIEEDGEAEVTCQFCESRYHFDKEHLERLSMIASAKGL